MTYVSALPGIVRLAHPDTGTMIKRRHSCFENLSGGDLPDFVREFDCCANLCVSKAGFSCFLNVVLDAGYAITANCGTKRNQFTFTMSQISHVVSYLRLSMKYRLGNYR
jgi:hypothetical protein